MKKEYLELLKSMTQEERIKHCQIFVLGLSITLVLMALLFFYFKNINYHEKVTTDPNGNSSREIILETKNAVEMLDEIIKTTTPNKMNDNVHKAFSNPYEEKLDSIHYQLIKVRNELIKNK